MPAVRDWKEIEPVLSRPCSNANFKVQLFLLLNDKSPQGGERCVSCGCSVFSIYLPTLYSGNILKHQSSNSIQEKWPNSKQRVFFPFLEEPLSLPVEVSSENPTRARNT